MGVSWFWNDSRDDILRQDYPTKGSRHCAERIGCSMEGVKKRAARLGLTRPMPGEHKTTPQLDDAIRRLYGKVRKNGDVARFAEKVAKPAWWISDRAVELGLVAAGSSNTPWSEAEIKFVEERPLLTAREVAAQMRKRGWARTPTAVRCKRLEIRIDRETFDQLTSQGVADLLGVTQGTVTTWARSGLLKATRRDSEADPRTGNAFVIREIDLAEFIVQNPAKISLAKIEPNKAWFIDFMSRCAAPARLDGGNVQERAVMLRNVRPDLTSAQIADMIGSTQKSVDVMVSRARAAERKAA